MTQEELQDIIQYSEVSTMQFKERINDNYSIGCELVAFSNSKGGRLIIGIRDKTEEMNPLSPDELKETNKKIANIATQNVDPRIGVDIESVPVENGYILVVNVAEGLNKPYKDNKGIIWAKQGSDKRRILDNSEIANMMAECGSFSPDEAVAPGVTLADLDESTLKTFFLGRFSRPLENQGINSLNIRSKSINEVVTAIASNFTLEQLLKNIHLLRADGRLTVAATLLLATYPQRFLPTLTVKCVSFMGNSVGSKMYRDMVKDSDIEGNLLYQYNTIMNFFTRNLKCLQPGEEFNAQGKYEISMVALSELVVNALVHRSIAWEAPIRIFIFDNRVEIHSPGTLPKGLRVEDVERGTSIPRNQLLFTNAINLLPYFGIGTGIPRALEEDVKIHFENDESLNEFVITIPRQESNPVEGPKNEESVQVEESSIEKSVQVGSKSVQAEESSTEKSVQVGSKSVQADESSTEKSVQAEEPNGRESNQAEKKVTKKQQDILNFCSVPRTASEIMDRAGIINHSANRARYIGALVDAGLLEPLFPNSPTSPNQKYRKTKQ